MFDAINSAHYRADATLRAAMMALNNAHAIELSFADEARIGMLVDEAFLAARIGMIDAMLIAFAQGAAYDSDNYRWFEARYASFVYIDRVVTAPQARGRGLARQLYAHLFAAARAAGYERIVCEVNSDPPNPASEAFHRSLGFAPVGEALLGNGKTVTYLALAL
ncbi:GNAT family acetyltransferase [Novosphingobium barchaimii LL02]|uniref:GNAT family acetyltransferase n=1 Tax=Novosphingobium barchaimii LL02 TaxID=1114963 RepID=A0A0J7Y9V7_9SPHN|nr:GNAT family N-acetyltransferase [Novosphingobium barchaimii]KMS60397.1 GNAT family acetyltransferase [Novosphingobium barchaimii LL02]